MKITIVQGAFLPVPPLMGGAVEKVWFALGNEFARRGHTVTHLSRSHPDLPATEVIDGVRHLRFPGFDTPRSLLRLKFCDLLYSLRVRGHLPAADILVTHTFWLPMLVRSRKFGRVYVHVGRYPKGQMRFYAHAARLQTVSSPIADAIRSEVPALAHLVCSIPNPLPDVGSRPPVSGAGESREKRILYVGRIHPEKGLQLLIESLIRLPRETMAGWKVVIVGPAEAKFGGGGASFLAELRQLSAPLGDRVEWTGPVFDLAELAAHYRRASLFVYPSLAERGETFGLAPLEAMAQGCPPLVSDLACFRDFITDPDTGFAFDHRVADPAAALAARLTELLADPERLAATGQRARIRSADFHLDKIATRYLDDFQSLLPVP